MLGAGPAGCTAAIVLGRGGARPLLIDRQDEAGDALCGGFLSWRTAAQLRDIGCDPARMGGWPVTRLALFAGSRRAQASLPAPGFGLSRHTLDNAMRRAALEAGAELAIDHAKAVESGIVHGKERGWRGDSVFLAAGKHDVRGMTRPRKAGDPALGLRLRVDGSAALAQMVGETIELHLFAGGYAGIVRQQGGSVNICLAVRKSLLRAVGGDPRALLARLADRHPAFGERMNHAGTAEGIDTVGAVPYGYIARQTQPGLFRLGDQAAVIPSLAGEGMAIAVASGLAAGRAYLGGGADMAPRYQRGFARHAWRPVRTAERVWQLAERERGAAALLTLAGLAPPLTRAVMRLSRIAQPSRVIQPWRSSAVPS